MVSLTDKGHSKESGCERFGMSELFIAHEYRTQRFSLALPVLKAL